MKKQFKTQEDLKEYANKINGKKISDIPILDKDFSFNSKNKGLMGQFIEVNYFGLSLNSKSSPDFEELGVELKVSPLKKLKDKTLSPKERIKLSVLDLDDLIKNENIKNSIKWPKIKKILIMWYEKNDLFMDNKISHSEILELEKTEFFQEFKNDWKILRDMAIKGDAHKFSESLTKYLGLARCGSGRNEKKINQKLNENNPYYKRAFTLKTQFLKSLLNNENNISNDEQILKMFNKKFQGKTFDFFWKEPLFPKNISQKIICNEFNVSNMSSLSKYLEKEFGEILTIKTVPLKTVDPVRIKESFKINVSIVPEIHKEWFDSKFSIIFENNFLISKIDWNKENILKSKFLEFKYIKFSDSEIEDVKWGFEEFKYRYNNSTLTDIKGNISFLKNSDNKGAHFRPSSKNSKIKKTTPGNEEFVNPALWINNRIIEGKL